MNFPLPADEESRLEALRRYEILDTPYEQAFERITRLAATLFDVPIALVSLVDEDRQWLKSCFGLGIRQTERDVSFCAHAIVADDVMIVPDATKDPRFTDNPLVTSPPCIRFYAGAPLRTPDGYNVGTLCIIDTEPRGTLDSDQIAMLSDLAGAVMDLLELRLAESARERADEEKHRAERDLRSVQALLAAIVDSAEEAIFSRDRGGIITSWNRGAEALYGYTAEEAVGRPVAMLIPPHREGEDQDILAKALSGELMLHYETERKAKDGTLREVSLTVSPLRDDSGKTIGASSIARDIGERKRAEEELRRSEERAQAIMATANDAYIAIDDSSRITEWNRAAEAMFGWAREEALGLKITETIIPERYRAGHEEGLLRFLQTGEARILNRRIEISAVGRGGKEFPVELTIWPLSHEDKATFHAFVRDISIDKQQRGALEEQAQLLGLVHDAIMARDLEGRIAYWNETAEAYYGWSKDEALGRISHELLATVFPKPREDIEAALLRDGRWQGELIHTRRDGSPLVVASRWAMRRDEHGEPLQILEANNDITEERAAAEELRTARDQAERANRAKSEFLSRMSHELRTPLNAILGFGQLLEMDELNADQRDSVAEIIRGGKHLLELINEVLDISRIESGRLAISLESVSVAAVVEESLALVRPLASQRGISIEGDEGAIRDVYVKADQQRCKQVLLNLLSNAVKYNVDGGRVTVGVDVSDDVVEITVADTGHGIAPEDMERLFAPFDRLGAEQTDAEGTGLGLTISKGLVETMGGSITARSTPAQGSAFTVALRRATVPQEAVPASRDTRRQFDRSSPARILYVEDNPANLRLVQRVLLDREGIEVVAAATGEQAIRLALRDSFDVVLLDLHLPDMDGIEVLRRLRRDAVTSSVPVVVLSADATPGQVRRLLSAGARRYLTKPFDLRALMDAIDELVAEAIPDLIAEGAS